jgi:hypothetical protein
VQIDATGSGYTTPPTVTFAPPASQFGVQAQGSASIQAGNVVVISVTNPGSGYTSAPAITISGGGGSSANAIAKLGSGIVTAITLTEAGSGYTSPLPLQYLVAVETMLLLSLGFYLLQKELSESLSRLEGLVTPSPNCKHYWRWWC